MIPYDIQLRSHKSQDATTGCGEEIIANLCSKDDRVCTDNDGSYEVQVKRKKEYKRPRVAYQRKSWLVCIVNLISRVQRVSECLLKTCLTCLFATRLLAVWPSAPCFIATDTHAPSLLLAPPPPAKK